MEVELEHVTICCNYRLKLFKDDIAKGLWKYYIFSQDLNMKLTFGRNVLKPDVRCNINLPYKKKIQINVLN